jgi:hypothetical protein
MTWHDPIPARVAQALDLAVGQDVERTAVMAQEYRAHVDLFDHAFVLADLDVFAQPERVVHQEECARDDVAHERLRAEADRHADHAGASKQRQDVHSQRGQERHRGHHYDGDQDEKAKERQQRAHARCRNVCVHVALGRQTTVDRRLRDLPQEVGEQQHDADAEERARDLAAHARLRDRENVDVPEVGEQQQPDDRDDDVNGAAKDGLVGRYESGTAELADAGVDAAAATARHSAMSTIGSATTSSTLRMPAPDVTECPKGCRRGARQRSPRRRRRRSRATNQRASLRRYCALGPPRISRAIGARTCHTVHKMIASPSSDTKISRRSSVGWLAPLPCKIAWRV